MILERQIESKSIDELKALLASADFTQRAKEIAKAALAARLEAETFDAVVVGIAARGAEEAAAARARAIVAEDERVTELDARRGFLRAVVVVQALFAALFGWLFATVFLDHNYDDSAGLRIALAAGLSVFLVSMLGVALRRAWVLVPLFVVGAVSAVAAIFSAIGYMMFVDRPFEPGTIALPVSLWPIFVLGALATFELRAFAVLKRLL